jgi:hypothetical protein
MPSGPHFADSSGSGASLPYDAPVLKGRSASTVARTWRDEGDELSAKGRG